MKRGRAKEVIKEIDDVLHIVTGHRIPYWGKKAWEELRSSKDSQKVIGATQAADDPYSVLGVDRNDRPSDIVNRYRELANQYHPDHGGDVEEFKRIQKAYEEISREWNK